jgi:hybrid polyketide synthase/nonribosomal peptide synthetase ACE1
LTDIAAHVTTTTLLGMDSTISTILRACWARDKNSLPSIYVHNPSTVTVVTPMELVESKTVPSGLCVVDWAATAKVDAQIQPADVLVRFKHDKTYWLVGLTGGLGLSLCRWMVDRGARYVVMTSRNPSIDLSWLASLQDLGATVKIFAR